MFHLEEVAWREFQTSQEIVSIVFISISRAFWIFPNFSQVHPVGPLSQTHSITECISQDLETRLREEKIID